MFVSLKVLFALSTLVVAAFAASTGSRIIGGSTAAVGSAPWAGSIQVGLFNPTHTCGGNVIATRYILTAGHCGYNLIGPLTGVISQYVNFRVGSNYLSSGGTRYLVTYGVLHPDFHEATGYANLAILQTVLTMNVGTLVSPAPLQTVSPTFSEAVTVAGWGALSVGGTNSEQLHSLSTTTITYEDCTAQASEASEDQGIVIPAIYEAREICTVQDVGIGNCNGDQGNGLVSEDGFLIGVLSWTFPCGAGGPEVYTRVDFYYSWIQSVIS